MDLAAEAMLVREKKRSKSQWTTRHVSLAPARKNVPARWLATHPGGIRFR